MNASLARWGERIESTFAAGRRARPHSEVRRTRAVALVIAVASTVAAGTALADAAGAPGDEAERLWAVRADGVEEPPAPAGATEAAYAAYQRARAASDRDLGLVWRELRTAHYLIDFTDAPDAERERVGSQAVALADRVVARLQAPAEGEDLVDLDDDAFAAWLARTGQDRRDLAMTYFWSAIVWGAHSQRLGLIAIVRKGVASRLHDYARIALRLDPTIERGGSQRLLSRLHGDLPRVPFISGWVDRDRTLPFAEQALAVDPADPGNKMIVALAWLDSGAKPEAEARALLEEVAALAPRDDLRTEDLTIRRDARERLTELGD